MTDNTKLFLILTLIFPLCFTSEDTTDNEFHCTHDEIDHQHQLLDVKEDMSTQDTEGRLLGSKYNNIRIHTYFETLTSTSPPEYKAYIQNELVPPVADYFRAALQVKYPVLDQLKIATTVENICGTKVPPILYTGVTADYFIFFDSEYNQASWVALSSACYLADVSKRPLIAKTKFNRKMLKPANGNVLIQEKNVYLLLHEMIHTFGFSGSMYEFFLDKNGKQLKDHIKQVNLLGTPRTVLDIPSLTQKARKFFGCPSLEGVFLEQNGGAGTAGSHLERRHFVIETMTSGVIHGRRISQFSLGFLEATGWYVPDYNYAEPYFFGQGQGCNFLKQSCSSNGFSFEEFCQGSYRGCSPSGRGGGVCSSDSNSDGCSFMFPSIDYDCENVMAKTQTYLPNIQVFGVGAGSKCFGGDLTNYKSTSKTSFCFTYTCKGSGGATSLEVNVGDQKVICQKEGQLKVEGFNGSLDCPDPLTFCKTSGLKYCPRNCMGRGTCVDNKCVCRKGFKGTDCGLNV